MTHFGFTPGVAVSHVTAAGRNSNYCKVEGFEAYRTCNTNVKFRCFTAQGVPADTQYLTSYVTAL
jgi:hypothetical protein